jgi:plasmid maintenance system killer protein
VILNFLHKGLARFWRDGSLSGIGAEFAPRLARQLRQLSDAGGPAGMNMPG